MASSLTVPLASLQPIVTGSTNGNTDVRGLEVEYMQYRSRNIIKDPIENVKIKAATSLIQFNLQHFSIEKNQLKNRIHDNTYTLYEHISHNPHPAPTLLPNYIC